MQFRGFIILILRKETENMSNERTLDQKRLNAMKYKILAEEKKNLNTREKTNDQMVDIIRRIINEESNKNY